MKGSTFDIRRRFLDYFKSQGHVEVPSSSVIPLDDPTLLFTNAGMNQFKDAFLGNSRRDYTRATTSQKCIRAGGKHNDLENVGHTTRHLTFFEMLGNFSFGDYFKKETIKFSWEVSTNIFKISEERIWPTVYKDDEEAFELWKQYVPSSRITRFGEKENFWVMGDTGPCGPCSELLFDRGDAYGSANNPLQDALGERFLEFWNLVFMQYNRQQDGSICALPRPSIDTGIGLERILMLVHGKKSVFETDVLQGLIQAVERVSGIKYDPDSSLAPAFRVIADHMRSLCFAIADGSQPSNVERGYVLRKILRRAVRYGKQLGFDAPFLGKILPDLVERMEDPYIELKRAQHHIEEVLTLEEEAFFKTLRRGGTLLYRIVEEAKKKSDEISGDDAFLLKDTYGLSFEEIQLIAIDNDLSINTTRFLSLEEEAKERSRASRKEVVQVVQESCYDAIVKEYGPCRFLRPTPQEVEAKVIACVRNGERVDLLKQGESGIVILDITPFYAEKGGQVGDRGVLRAQNITFIVDDTQAPFSGIIVQIGKVKCGEIIVGHTVTAIIDYERRVATERNHTATHLLHLALHEILGEHAHQGGSLVCPEYFRFDFSHHKSLTTEELVKVEERVNQLILENLPVSDYELLLEEVQKHHDIKQFFGEKYGSVVRVLEVGPSKELCGGTHIMHTGSIGYFRILKEYSIAAGMRRIEGITALRAVREARNSEKALEALSLMLKVPLAKLKEKISRLVIDNKALEGKVKSLCRERIRLHLVSLQKDEKKRVLFGKLSIASSELGLALEEIEKMYPDFVAIIGCVDKGKAYLSIKVPKQRVEPHAGELLKEGLAFIEGMGGGKRENAQGAGNHPEKIREAIQAVVKKV